MAILIDESTEAIVQGITGREARIRVRTMMRYGTRIVAGVTPGRGGQFVDNIPVSSTVEEARSNHPGINASAIFVPARFARNAAFEAIDAGIKLITLHPERVPYQDMLEVIAYAKQHGAIVIGPNTLGLISPERALLGMIGGSSEVVREWFMPGPVGVISRSGGSTATLCYYLTQKGIGQSTAISVGGDACVGTTWVDLLPLFEQDPETRVVVAFGEVGTSIEVDAAQMLVNKEFTKPLIAYIAGRYARPGVRFGHAGALVGSIYETVENKQKVLKESGAYIVDHLPDIGETVAKVLNSI
jgi:succinyl-CoA synthetase alpha subunit